MNLLIAIILGLIQGLTEFIPISSTAHLTIAGKLFGIIDNTHPEHWTAFIAVIQLGTLVSVLVFFRRELIDIINSLFKENFTSNRKKIKDQSDNSKLGWLIIIGSIPIFTIGFLLKKIIVGNLTKDLSVIAGSLIGLAIILFIAEKMSKLTKEIKKITLTDSLIIGFAQCLALIPGSSRSGTTITAGLFLGINRESAARFSFLLSIPAILVSGLYQLVKSIQYIDLNQSMALIAATLVAGISGYLSIAFLLKFLRTKTTLIFIIYRIVLGLLLIYLLYNGII